MGLVICQVFIDFLVLDFFSRVEECTLLQCLHTDVLVFVTGVILTVCVIICYQVYKVFFAYSRSSLATVL